MEVLYKSILSTFAYFDIFSHPLTAEEVHSFANCTCTKNEIEEALNELANREVLFKCGKFYATNSVETLVAKRLKANAVAEKQIASAERIAKFLSHIPFVKGVALSGSLSKKIATEKSDFDFFIITSKNRLWISKLLFSFVTKTAGLLGKGKYFCLNYLIDETYLEVEEKNIFTATEIVTLLPLYGKKIFTDFFSKNEWTLNCYPAKFTDLTAQEIKRSFAKRFSEWLLNIFGGNSLNNFLMRFFSKRWKKMLQQNKFMESGFQFGAMKVSKSFCRPYPEHFQKKILHIYQQRFSFLKARMENKMLLVVSE